MGGAGNTYLLCRCPREIEARFPRHTELEKYTISNVFTRFTWCKPRLESIAPVCVEPVQPMSPSPSIILFDGVCNLCNASVNFVIDRDPAAHFRFGALQSEGGRALLAAHDVPDTWLDSIVLIEGDRVYTASDAALRIARRLPGAWSLLWVFRVVPRPIRDAVYNWIARNRYRWFGRQDSCRMPTPDLAARFIP